MQIRAFWHSLNLCPVLKTFLLVQCAIMPKETILLRFAAMVALTTQLLDVIVHKKYFPCIAILNFGHSVPHIASEPGG